MLVYWVAGAQLLFYLCCTPFCINARLIIGDEVQLEMGFSLFEARRPHFKKHSKFQKKPGSIVPKAPSALEIQYLRGLFRHLNAFDLRLSGVLCLGDAAQTALMVGCIRNIEYALHPFWPNLRLNIQPDFSGDQRRIDIQGMIALPIGQIIYAALWGTWKHINRRIAQWIDIRLKAL